LEEWEPEEGQAGLCREKLNHEEDSVSGEVDIIAMTNNYGNGETQPSRRK
jgi:hypothetical protein